MVNTDIIQKWIDAISKIHLNSSKVYNIISIKATKENIFYREYNLPKFIIWDSLLYKHNLFNGVFWGYYKGRLIMLYEDITPSEHLVKENYRYYVPTVWSYWRVKRWLKKLGFRYLKGGLSENSVSICLESSTYLFLNSYIFKDDVLIDNSNLPIVPKSYDKFIGDLVATKLTK